MNPSEDRPASEQPWRQRDGRTVLLAGRRNGRLHFPPLPPSSPLFADGEIVELSPRASLYSFTVVHAGPKTGKPPVALGMADFAEGVRVFGRIECTPGRRPVIGEALRVCLSESEHGPIYAFEPEQT